MRYLIYLPLLLLVACRQAADIPKPAADPWIGGWSKPAVNPVLTADSGYVWTDPLTDAPVRWQRADVFNPAATVIGDSV